MRHFLDSLVDVFLLEIQRGRTGILRQLQPLRHRVDRNYPFGAKQEGAADCELPDGTAAPDRDRLATLQVAEIRRHVTGWKDIGQKEYLLVAKTVRHLDWPDIGVRYPQILGLTAGKAA